MNSKEMIDDYYRDYFLASYYQNNSHKWLQNSSALDGYKVRNEMFLRAFKTQTFAQDHLILIIPAFDSERRYRQAQNMCNRFSTQELMDSLPTTLWYVVVNAYSKSAPTTFLDTAPMLDVYDMAAAHKANNPKLSEEESLLLKSFSDYISAARERAYALTPPEVRDAQRLESAYHAGAAPNPEPVIMEENETLSDRSTVTTQIMSNAYCFLEYILEGTPPAETITPFFWKKWHPLLRNNNT